MQHTMTTQTLTLSPEVELTILLDGDRLLGIGQVTIGGILVRADAVPIRPDFSTPDAIHFQDFVLLAVEQTAAGIVLHTEALGRPELYGEMMDEYSYNLAVPRVRGQQRDRLDWLLAPSALTLDGERYVGLSLAFHFHSDRNAIHKVTTEATWEIGGHADGNTIYHQSYTCPPVYTATTANHFSTTCLKRLDLWDSPLGHSYQMLPRWGAIQPFDFQAADAGVLLGYWSAPHSVKSLVQKNPGEDVIFVLDEYDFPLTTDAILPAKHILFSAGQRAPHQIVDMWTRACDHTAAVIRGFFGITPCQPLLSDSPNYAGRNSVAREELIDGPQPNWLWQEDNGKFYFLLDGEKIERRELLYWLADTKLPQLKAQGMTRLSLEPIHESDFTEDAFAYHAQTGWHGDLTVCSICGSRRYVPAECYAANRSLTLVQQDHNDRYPYIDGLDLTYALLQPLMQTRYLLPDDQGVRWESPAGQALFAYAEFACLMPAGARVERIERGQPVPLACPAGVLLTEAWTAYRILQ
jgi:hypothetical protein